ncbi:MAG: polymer-forming cytoskeletal protein [Gammaproteobacteria bacterium]|nr:polymer-forming cytoskeletal protein [Gammaproteobacteria bacterium]
MKNRLNNAVTTLVGSDATVTGNLIFDRGCHVAGTVKGDVAATDDKKSELAVAQTGRIEGNARAARMLVQGTIVGDLRCSGTVTLKSTARIEGSIAYGQIEIEKGAVVMGQLLVGSADSAGSAAGPGPGSESTSTSRMQPSLT